MLIFIKQFIAFFYLHMTKGYQKDQKFLSLCNPIR